MQKELHSKEMMCYTVYVENTLLLCKALHNLDLLRVGQQPCEVAETEAQRSQVTYTTSHSKSTAEPYTVPKSLGSKLVHVFEVF